VACGIKTKGEEWESKEKQMRKGERVKREEGRRVRGKFRGGERERRGGEGKKGEGRRSGFVMGKRVDPIVERREEGWRREKKRT